MEPEKAKESKPKTCPFDGMVVMGWYYLAHFIVVALFDYESLIAGNSYKVKEIKQCETVEIYKLIRSSDQEIISNHWIFIERNIVEKKSDKELKAYIDEVLNKAEKYVSSNKEERLKQLKRNTKNLIMVCFRFSGVCFCCCLSLGCYSRKFSREIEGEFCENYCINECRGAWYLHLLIYFYFILFGFIL
jgi:hypothetical protein